MIEKNDWDTYINIGRCKNGSHGFKLSHWKEVLLTVKLLLMFLVLVSATLASERSTSSNMRDYNNKVCFCHQQTLKQAPIFSTTWGSIYPRGAMLLPLNLWHSREFCLAVWNISSSISEKSWSVWVEYPPLHSSTKQCRERKKKLKTCTRQLLQIQRFDLFL